MTLDEVQTLNLKKKPLSWIGFVFYKEECKFIHEKMQWIIILAGRHDC